MEPLIRHIRYDDFVALISGGVHTLDAFKRTVDTLVAAMGGLRDHHVLFDLRSAVIPPLPEVVLIAAFDHLRLVGLGVLNKLAIVYDPADEARAARMRAGARIATLLGLRLEGFDDYAQALEWLGNPESGRIGDAGDAG